MEINEFNRAVITQEITHDMAEQVALRIISGAFNRTDKRPQFSIPVRPDDDDIILMEYLRRQKSPWRDIESAPRDGTKIVVGIYFDGGKYPEEARWDFWVDSWRKYATGYGEGFGKPYHPTHWMPLPNPPR